eukprot:CAMPEP_0182942896 /NCGR_PEP_ID=MMETSP0105_2-20130417/51487_1 /TAXON_ID=81532 ORGANISM="Acanthoeca-like sp., Strain 10tr" /NCGR_SAMPLE_ID=MMETSP0105_2 /ASSEMBLY_ACC=CAM_ASM_000205 /LENGTH=33 /DNA_ID= /DNA_START= /DNA_END= /DNA_ORIENTATION=
MAARCTGVNTLSTTGVSAAAAASVPRSGAVASA